MYLDDDDTTTIAGTLTGEAVLNSTAEAHGIRPGALRLLLGLWVLTRAGRRAARGPALFGLGVCTACRARGYLVHLDEAGAIQRERATATGPAFIHLTDSGAAVVQAYLLAAGRAKRATARKLREKA